MAVKQDKWPILNWFSVQTHTWHAPVSRILLALPGGLCTPEAGRGIRPERGWTQEACRLLDEDRGAADGSSDACALVERAGLEGLSVHVMFSVQITAHRHHV